MDIQKWLDEHPDLAKQLEAHFRDKFTSSDEVKATQEAKEMLDEMVTMVGAKDKDGAKQLVSEMVLNRQKAQDQARKDEIRASVDRALSRAQKPLLTLFTSSVIQELGDQEFDDESVTVIVQELVQNDEGVKLALRALAGPEMKVGKQQSKAAKDGDPVSDNIEIVEV